MSAVDRVPLHRDDVEVCAVHVERVAHVVRDALVDEPHLDDVAYQTFVWKVKKCVLSTFHENRYRKACDNDHLSTTTTTISPYIKAYIVKIPVYNDNLCITTGSVSLLSGRYRKVWIYSQTIIGSGKKWSLCVVRYSEGIFTTNVSHGG